MTKALVGSGLSRHGPATLLGPWRFRESG